MRVALDLLGGDAAPGVVVDGALLAAGLPGVQVVLVGPPEVAERELAARGASARFRVVPASGAVDADADPARAVRRQRGASVRVAAALLRDGEVDALVSAGPSGATVAAAVFAVGTLPGATRAALAVVVPTPSGPLVLLDAGATARGEADLLAQLALSGSAYAGVALGLPRPRVGLLTGRGAAGAVDRHAHDLLSAVLEDLPVAWVGDVDGRDVARGGRADVVVTDGSTGEVLLQGLEGAALAVEDVLLAAGEHAALAALAAVAVRPERRGGAVLLGVDGVVVAADGAPSPEAVARSVGLAAAASRGGLVPRVAEALERLVRHRRTAAGLGSATP